MAARVLRWEGARDTRVELVLLDAPAMRRLNRRATGRRGLTDVIAFSLPQPDGRVLGEVYICPAVAGAFVMGGPSSARPAARPPDRLHEELVRLVVHGTLHVLGYDHPEGANRMRSAMWRRQERYVRRFVSRNAR